MSGTAHSATTDLVIEQMSARLIELGYRDLRYDFSLSGSEGMAEAAALVAFDEDVPVVLCYPVESGQTTNAALQEGAKFQAVVVQPGESARFVWLSDGTADYFFDMGQESALAQLPRQEEWRDSTQNKMSVTRRARLQAGERQFDNYRDLQEKLNELHEELYRKRAGVSTTNEAIDEVGKVIFLKIHSERHPEYLFDGVRLTDAFRAEHIRRSGGEAVGWFSRAFKQVAALPEYEMPDLANGGRTSIFPPDEPFRLNNPDVLAYAVSIFERLQLTVDRDHDPERVSEDLLGWAFNVFLRGKYSSSGGMATYLTRKEVVDCMVRMAFHDIADEALWAGYPTRPQFRMGDITCGTGSFIVGGLAEVKRRVLDTIIYDRDQQLEWLQKLKQYSIFGADASPASITKAHLNLLTFGATAHQLIRVQDSIFDPVISRLRGQIDLLFTNPPFGKGQYTSADGLEAMRRGDLQLGWSWPPGHPEKRKALTKADPAALFIDRNLELLKPGGRLLIVVPDGLLSNAGDRYVREYIMGVKEPETGLFVGGKAIVKAVVSLPTQTFAISGTGAKTSFLYLQKKRHIAEPQGPIFMAVAEHVGYIKKGNTEVPDPDGNDLLAIANAYIRGNPNP